MATPEIPQIREHATDFEPTPDMQEQGIVSTPSQIQSQTIQISDNQQATMTPVPAPADDQTIQIPADPKVLQQQSQGDISDASTWSAVFWLRLIKKAINHGLRVIIGGGSNA